MKCKTFKGNKTFDLTEIKAVSDGNIVKISGYANTKFVADRYGDIPAPYNRAFVYDLEEFKRNPVLLLNHAWDVKNIAGGVTAIKEDERGLYFEATLSASNLPELEHAKTLIKEGYLKTVSIGGMWKYENPDNSNQLTLAKIFEISLVSVPADPNATFHEVKEAEEAPAADKATDEKKEQEKQFANTALEKIFSFEAEAKIKQFEVKTKGPKEGKE